MHFRPELLARTGLHDFFLHALAVCSEIQTAAIGQSWVGKCAPQCACEISRDGEANHLAVGIDGEVKTTIFLQSGCEVIKIACIDRLHLPGMALSGLTLWRRNVALQDGKPVGLTGCLLHLRFELLRSERSLDHFASLDLLLMLVENA